VLQNLEDRFPEIRHRARPTDLSLDPLRRIIDMHHRPLFRNAFYRAQRNPTQPRDLGLRMARLQ
jgi:hypothetical protein